MQDGSGPQAAAPEVLAASEQCVVCMQNRRDTVLMGCRHLVLCLECSEAVRDCPVCRATISSRIPIFT
ncbi:hypothetical protein DFJ73DRAFT_831623 [Zopfochytrium polystomum]|nr:hypothetical protein DFJ73DRAFT_831623 [Zopfochytrium polystomum]